MILRLNEKKKIRETIIPPPVDNSKLEEMNKKIRDLEIQKSNLNRTIDEMIIKNYKTTQAMNEKLEEISSFEKVYETKLKDFEKIIINKNEEIKNYQKEIEELNNDLIKLKKNINLNININQEQNNIKQMRFRENFDVLNLNS